ncbi:MAG: cytochrome c biogenesis protein [Spirochaetes bacterium]|nr:cytochrome c biogenesis protein [Spirochaetota bacterium]
MYLEQRMKHAARLVHFAMPIAIIMAFCYAPTPDLHGETGRLLFFHVPLAWTSTFAFAVAGCCAIAFIFRKRLQLEAIARFSVEIGLLFTILATASGAIWSKLSWGSFWNWDPRQTSIIMLMLIYLASISLNASLKDHPSRATIVSAYLIIAFVTLPFWIIVFPKIFGSLHPQSGSLVADFPTKISLVCSVVAFTLLYLTFITIKLRLFLLYNDEAHIQ